MTTSPVERSLAEALKLIASEDRLWRGFAEDFVRVTFGLSPTQPEMDFMTGALQVCAGVDHVADGSLVRLSPHHVTPC
jgi:hypothetical protein